MTLNCANPGIQTAEPREYVITEPPRILIVEDDPDMAKMIALMMKRLWINCKLRRSGAQGISAFAEEPFDLIITDLKMAAGDGVSLIQTVRRTSRTPVIIVTGYSREYADLVQHLENVAVITKPFDPRLLIETVEKALKASTEGRPMTPTLAPRATDPE